MMDPVLATQYVMSTGDLAGVTAAPAASKDQPRAIGEFSNKQVSNLLAGMVVGAVGVLIALRVAGFRFSFGASINTGGS